MQWFDFGEVVIDPTCQLSCNMLFKVQIKIGAQYLNQMGEFGHPLTQQWTVEVVFLDFDFLC